MAEMFLGVILRSCTGGVSLSLPVMAFSLLREGFFQGWFNCIPLSPWGGFSYSICRLPLPPPPCLSTGPQSPRLCFSSPSLSPTELPCLCLGVVPLSFASQVFSSGQVSCLLPLSPFHLHRLILSLLELFVFCVVGVSPCLSCKLVRMMRFFGGSQPREWNRALMGVGEFFMVGHTVLCMRTCTPLPASPAGATARAELPEQL